MQHNERAKGPRTLRAWHAGGNGHALATEAYQQADPTSIRRVAIAYWGEVAEFAYWCYDLLNPLCYGNRIAHPLFQFCRVMPYGGCIGLAHGDDLDRPVIDIFRSLWTQSRDFPLPYLAVFATVTHEMMHFASRLRWRDAGAGFYRTSHNNEFWLRGVAAASPLLGVNLKRLQEPFSRWPHGGWSPKREKELNAALRERRFSP
jgi:hypothetical protein